MIIELPRRHLMHDNSFKRFSVPSKAYMEKEQDADS